MLSFGRMHVIGFGPILDETFYWDQPGLNIVKADNGSGKSKFINALVWALYGKTLSGSVETWESYKPKKYEGTKVEVNFNKGSIKYKVTRCKGYTGLVNGVKGKNRLIIEEDGKEISSDGKADAKEELAEILGYSMDLFKNSIIFGQKLKRLVSETGPNKKKILDEAFEVVYISRAYSAAQDRVKVLNERIYKYDVNIEAYKTKVTSLKEEIEREEQRLKDFDKTNKKDLKVEKEAIEELRVQLRDNKNNLSKQDDVNELISAHRETIKKLKTERDALGKPEVKHSSKKTSLSYKKQEAETLFKSITKLKEGLSKLPTNCPNCGKPFTEKERKEEVKRIMDNIKEKEKLHAELLEQIDKLRDELNKLETAMSSEKRLTTSITNTEELIKALEKVRERDNLINQKLENIRESINSHKRNIQKIKERTPPKNFDKTLRVLKDAKRELKAETKAWEEVQKEKEDYMWLIADPLSNAGLKAFIFDTMLESINDRLDYYAKFSGMRVGFLIDMDSARKDVNTVISNEKGEYVPYDDLSGGQQQKVDIVTVFATHDVVSENKDCNLLIMDELFESLDKNNIELLTELIQDKAKDKCLYLVTHRHEFSPTNANIIEVLYEDGITTLAN